MAKLHLLMALALAIRRNIESLCEEEEKNVITQIDVSAFRH